jgi:hypothetical protein
MASITEQGGAVRGAGTASSLTEGHQLDGGLSPERVRESLRKLAREETVRLTVGFSRLNDLCDLLLREGWRILNIDLMEEGPGCVISAKNGPLPAPR